MKKDSKYSFMVNKQVKEDFKAYCKVMNISPSDVLMEVMIGFNSDAEKIIKMKDIDELRSLFRQKVSVASDELDQLEVKRKQQLDSGAEVLSNAGYECRE